MTVMYQFETEMTKKPMTPEQLQAWLKNIENAHEEATNLIKCVLWALRSMDAIAGTIGKQSKVDTNIDCFPDDDMRNFQQMGKEFDRLCAQIHQLPPDGQNGNKYRN